MDPGARLRHGRDDEWEGRFKGSFRRIPRIAVAALVTWGQMPEKRNQPKCSAQIRSLIPVL